MQMLWKIACSFLKKIKSKMNMWTSNSTCEYRHKRTEKQDLKRYSHISVHSSTIHKSCEGEANQVSINEWMNKWGIVDTHTSAAMLKIPQARLQQYMNHELPDAQGGFTKGRGARDQIDSISWIIKKAREFQKNIYFGLIDYAKAFDCVDHNRLENSSRDGITRPPGLPLEKSVCRSGSNS